ncbi:uncharacterized protein B0T15DRAFT_491313 [Chaetomium strumarium]|uniref:Uncharacterized protein n=1 Tax=Chaetomium strumarium TaxID=1170767 RepID=A0AAJ0GZ43_9PEZI|nr:hypothetical protein B0T15DRAFT_491313 [Chaetomium strumarium]
MIDPEYPRECAPTWLAANGGRPNAIHCEDGSCYDFEEYNSCLEDGDPNKVMTDNGMYLPKHKDKNGQQLYLQIAIYGAKNGANGYVGLQLPCKDGDPTPHPKAPRCQTVLRRLGISWCTEELIQAEHERRIKEAGGSGAAGPSHGGHAGGGRGRGGPGDAPGGAPGGGGGGGSSDAAGATGGGTTGSHGFQGPRGGSNAAYFSGAGGMSQAHGTTGHHYGYGDSYTSNLLASGMSGLSIGAGKPSAGAPKQTVSGLSKGQPSTNNVFTAFQDIGQGEVDSHGNPVYDGIVFDKKGKPTTRRVSVNIYGMAIDQRQYFCFNSDGNPFDKPPEVSEKDPDPARASKLYKLAKALYTGKMAAASTLRDHHDNSTTNRPSTAGSGGSGGEYTTRPGSRTGTTGISASYGYASVPRTAAYGQHSGAHYDAVPGAPSSRPSSRDGGPSQTAAQKGPSPPSKVKLDDPNSKSKSKSIFTVHGIDRGKPYIKGVKGDKDNQHYELSYSDKNRQFYISTGPSRKDRVYVTAA